MNDPYGSLKSFHNLSYGFQTDHDRLYELNLSQEWLSCYAVPTRRDRDLFRAEKQMLKQVQHDAFCF